MSVEIVHRGTPPNYAIFQGTCRSCKTVIRCEEADGERMEDRFGDTFLSLPCPVCNRTMHAFPQRTAITFRAYGTPPRNEWMK